MKRRIQCNISHRTHISSAPFLTVWADSRSWVDAWLGSITKKWCGVCLSISAWLHACMWNPSILFKPIHLLQTTCYIVSASLIVNWHMQYFFTTPHLDKCSDHEYSHGRVDMSTRHFSAAGRVNTSSDIFFTCFFNQTLIYPTLLPFIPTNRHSFFFLTSPLRAAAYFVSLREPGLGYDIFCRP